MATPASFRLKPAAPWQACTPASPLDVCVQVPSKFLVSSSVAPSPRGNTAHSASPLSTPSRPATPRTLLTRAALLTTARGNSRYNDRVARRASGALVYPGDDRPSMAGPHVHPHTARRRTLTSDDHRRPASSVHDLPFLPDLPASPASPTAPSSSKHLASLPESSSSTWYSYTTNLPFLRNHASRLHHLDRQLARLAARMPMPLELSGWHAHWLARLRSALRLLVIVLSGAVSVFLLHTLEIYRGNRYIDLRKGELPMTWPARTTLAPTIILLAVAVASFLASVAVVALSLKRSFRRPIRSAGIYRVVGGAFSVLLWIIAIAEFSLLDRASKASLGRYSCGNRDILSNGRYQYRAVCEEQGVAFYLAIGAATAELATLLTLALTTPASMDPRIAGFRDDHEKKRSMSISGNTKRLP